MMELLRQCNGVFVEARRIAADSGLHDLLGQQSNLLDKLTLICAGQHGQVGLAGIRQRNAALLCVLEHGADTRVRVLHIVQRVIGILLDSKVKVELHLGLSGAAVEEETRCIDRNLVEQVGQRQALAGTLGHADNLAALHHANKLHEHDLQTVRAVQTECIQSALQTLYMAVMVSAPDIDNTVKAALLKLVAMVSDIGRKVGIKTVCTAQNVVLVAAEVGRTEPQCAVLGLVGCALGGQHVDGLLNVAALVQSGLTEPYVVVDLVTLEVALHAGNVGRQTVALDNGKALLRGLFEQAVAVLLYQIMRQRFNVVALIPGSVKLDGVLAADLLDIAALNRMRELVYLIACIVDVELTGNVVAGPVQNRGQAVAQNAAARVAHVHRAGRVGGNELYHDLFRLFALGTAVILTHGEYTADSLLVPTLIQREIHKAGACDGHGVKAAALEVEVGYDALRDLARRHMQRLCALHGKGGCPVAVGGILRGLYRNRRNGALRQLACGYSLAVRRFYNAGCFGACDLICVHVYTPISKISYFYFIKRPECSVWSIPSSQSGVLP